MAKQYFTTPIGTFKYPWINRPDTQFNEDGLYHTKLVIKGKAAEVLAAKIEAAAQEALSKFTDEMTPAEAKKWSVFLPYEYEEDEEGNQTGAIEFSFKQNAKIRLRDGSAKEINITIDIHDRHDNLVPDTKVFGGFEGRIMFTMRPIKISQAKQGGVRLDFFKVQISKKVRKSRGFGSLADEDYAEEDNVQPSGGFGSASSSDGDGDY
jgi:hypothetical protein